MKEEGVIKFNCTWIKEEPLPLTWIKELNRWRNKFYRLGLIGVTKEGIGYGNMSIRLEQNQFIITGSATGKLKRLTSKQYTRVTAYNLDKNTLTTKGPIKASSESLTHAMIYQCASDANAVIHVHHWKLWEKLLTTLPATNRDVEYGTTSMAREIERLFTETNLAEHKLFAMAGHVEGVVSFGKNLAEAGKILLHALGTD